MLEEHSVHLLPAALYKANYEARDNAPTLIRESNIPCYDADYFFSKLSQLKPLFVRYKEITGHSIKKISQGKIGEVFQVRIGDEDVAIKIMFGSQIEENPIKDLMDLASITSAKEREMILQRLSHRFGIDPKDNILKNLGGLIIGNKMCPEYVDLPKFILVKNNRIIGFASQTIQGDHRSIGEAETWFGHSELVEVQRRMESAQVKFDRAVMQRTLLFTSIIVE